MAKELTSNITYFTTYGNMRKYNKYLKKHTDLTNFINGTVSSIISTTIAFPVDTIKTRKQTIQRNETLFTIINSVTQMDNSLTIKNLTKIFNLWNGLGPILIRVSLFGGIGMCLYEKARVFVRNNI